MKGHRPRPALKNKARPQSGSEDEDEDEQLSVSSNSEEILAAQRDGGRKRSVDDDLANKNFASVFADILGAEVVVFCFVPAASHGLAQVAKPDPILSRNPGFEGTRGEGQQCAHHLANPCCAQRTSKNARSIVQWRCA